jgi:hypothetical protein
MQSSGELRRENAYSHPLRVMARAARWLTRRPVYLSAFSEPAQTLESEIFRKISELLPASTTRLPASWTCDVSGALSHSEDHYRPARGGPSGRRSRHRDTMQHIVGAARGVRVRPFA